MSGAGPGGRISGPEAFADAFTVSREIVEKLKTYEALLRQWQRAVNLVAPGTLGEIWHRHFADSAQLARFAPEGPVGWLDLGSGAGFPGLVIAIMFSECPDVRVTLAESDARKAAFLREVARQTGAVVDIWAGRIESLSTQSKLEAVDIVSARALAPLSKLFEMSAGHFGDATKGLFLKGKDADREIEDASRHWDFAVQRVASVTEPEARLLVIEKLTSRTEG